MTTRISIHCYQGDAALVRDLLPLHQRHRFPITVMSPEDSPVEIPGVECRFGGRRQSAGQLSLDRQRRHMEMLLDTPDDLFLMHDADSICLSEKLPDYLVREDVLWSNLVYNPIPEQRQGYGPGVPRLAFQPPYFMSRSIIRRLLDNAEGVKVNPALPFIDHYMLQLAMKAHTVWKGFPDGISMAICTHPGFMELAQTEVRHKGRVFVHSVKSMAYLQPLLDAHEAWVRDYRLAGDVTPATEIDTTAPMRAVPLVRARWEGDKLIYGG